MKAWNAAGLIPAMIVMVAGANAQQPGRTDAVVRFGQHVADMKSEFEQRHPGGGIDDRLWVKARLGVLARIDQEADEFLANVPRGAEALKELQAQNTAELRSIVHRWGWIGEPDFDPSAANDAWLLLLHSNGDIAFQREVLAAFDLQIRKGQGDRRSYAYLYDSIALNPLNTSSAGLQRYGSKGRCVARGKWEPYASEDPERLDERRRSMELRPEADYVAYMLKVSDQCPTEEKSPYQ